MVFAESSAATFRGVCDEVVKRVSSVSREYRSRKKGTIVISIFAWRRAQRNSTAVDTSLRVLGGTSVVRTDEVRSKEVSKKAHLLRQESTFTKSMFNQKDTEGDLNNWERDWSRQIFLGLGRLIAMRPQATETTFFY